MLVNRSHWQGVGISFCETEDAMRASDEISDQRGRARPRSAPGATFGRQYFEVVVDTMA